VNFYLGPRSHNGSLKTTLLGLVDDRGVNTNMNARSTDTPILMANDLSKVSERVPLAIETVEGLEVSRAAPIAIVSAAASKVMLLRQG
jgi:hypothetical protein